jgi:hypothetical protein
MSALRYIDRDGREQVIDNINYLFELIKSRQFQSTNLVWDEGENRWICARDHEFFRRIREIAADSGAPKPSAAAADPPRQTLNNKEPSQALRGSDTNPSGKPKSRWFKPIKNREEALRARTCRETSPGPTSPILTRWRRDRDARALDGEARPNAGRPGGADTAWRSRFPP